MDPGAAVTDRQDDPWAEPSPDTEPVAPWTAEQVRALELRQAPLSPWSVVRVQVLVGALLALAWWLLGAEPALQLRSSLWGAAAVVLPHALMAWGLRHRVAQPAAALLSFLWWELMKLALAIAILVVAVWAVPDLSWPALLVALIGCLKVNVWALWWFARPGRTTN